MTNAWTYNAINSRRRISEDMAPYLERPVPEDFDPDEISSVNFINKAGDFYEKMLPLNQFIKEAIS